MILPLAIACCGVATNANSMDGNNLDSMRTGWHTSIPILVLPLLVKDARRVEPIVEVELPAPNFFLFAPAEEPLASQPNAQCLLLTM